MQSPITNPQSPIADAPIRLLIVDDEQDFIVSCAQALARRGIQVNMAFDGAAALRAAESEEFDVVLLDLRMPGLSGEEVFRRLQILHPHLPVIVLTGYGNVDHAFRASKEGVFDFLSKPCEPEALAARVREAAAAKRQRMTEKPAVKSPPEGMPLRVLLVDDEPEFLLSLKPVLQRRNMEVVTAGNGAEALQVLKQAIVEVVVLDVKMPGLDGLQVLQHIRREYPRLEVILLTGHPTMETAFEGMKLGACDYVMKPPDIDHLAQAIRKAHQLRLDKIEDYHRRLVEEIRSRIPD
jgi:DNA-binding NtrC family response regulator